MFNFWGYVGEKLLIGSGINCARPSTGLGRYRDSELATVYNASLTHNYRHLQCTGLPTVKFSVSHLFEYILCTQSTLPTITETSYN